MTDLKTFVEEVVKVLVDQHDYVDVREISGERTTVIELRVGEGDLGKVIGKGGRIANAIRTLLTAVAARQGKRAVLEIIEPGM